jgi:valyl-tRNA synthetase
MLSNERFVANAPANVIEENKKALDEVKTRLEKIEVELKSLA